MAQTGDCLFLLIEVVRRRDCNVAVTQHSGTDENPVPVANAAAIFFSELVQWFLVPKPVLTQPARGPFKNSLTAIMGVGRVRLGPEV